MNKVRYYLILGFILMMTIILIPSVSHAQQDNINLHIRAEASNDNGKMWHNYSGTEYVGGDTVAAKPGDTILLRIKLWNTDPNPAFGIEAAGSATNADYISSYSLISADADGNNQDYNKYFFTTESAGVGSINQVSGQGGAACTSGSHAECVTVSIKLSDNFPIGETIITGTARITNYTIGVAGNNNDNNWLAFFIDKAQAEGMGKQSTFRVAVNNNAPEALPAVGTPLSIYLSFFGIMILSIIMNIVRPNIKLKLKTKK